MKDDVRAVVTQLLDYTELARRAMAKYWDERSDAEKAEFSGILRDLIEAAYLGKISGNADYAVEFREELPKTNVGKILRRELRDSRPAE